MIVLTADHLKMADKVANIYTRRAPHLFDEVRSEALLELAWAAAHYDPSIVGANSRFEPFAAQRMRWAVLKWLAAEHRRQLSSFEAHDAHRVNSNEWGDVELDGYDSHAFTRSADLVADRGRPSCDAVDDADEAASLCANQDPDHLAAYVLRYAYGRTERAVARMLGLEPREINTRLAGARRRFRRTIEERSRACPN